MKKKIVLVVLSALFLIPYLSGSDRTEKASENKYKDGKPDKVLLDQSMIRMQNRIFVGLEINVNPSVNLLDEYLTRSMVSFRIGYRLGKNLMSGTLGVEFTDEIFLPITIEYKRYLNQNMWAPYLYAQTGVSWHLKGNLESQYNTSNYAHYSPGMLASVGIGYSYTTTLNEFYFSIGYSYRSYMETNVIAWNEEETIDKSMKGASITIGMTF